MDQADWGDLLDKMGMSKIPEHHRIAMFRKYDLDHNGFLDMQELFTQLLPESFTDNRFAVKQPRVCARRERDPPSRIRTQRAESATSLRLSVPSRIRTRRVGAQIIESENTSLRMRSSRNARRITAKSQAENDTQPTARTQGLRVHDLQRLHQASAHLVRPTCIR